MATILDIAKCAGVSPATVSRALRDQDVISAETRDRVKHLAVKMGYVPNRAASMLRTNTSNLVGVMIPYISNPIYALALQGIDDTLRSEKFHMFVSSTCRDADEEVALIEMFLQNRCAGLIVTAQESPTCLAAAEKLAHFNEEDRPLVFTGYEPPGNIEADRIKIDDPTGARMMVDHMVELGHRRIAFVGGKEGELARTRRLLGYSEGLQAHGIPVDSSLILSGGYDRTAGEESAPAIARMVADNRISAVVCFNDVIAIGLINTLLAMGIDVPGQVSVSGYDDIMEAQWISVPLTTINQKAYEIGCLCAQRILDRVADPKQAARHIEIRPELVVRKSVTKVSTQ